MKLKFHEDKWYQGELVYRKDEIAEVTEENGFAYRWIRRGAVKVEEEAAESTPSLGEDKKPADLPKVKPVANHSNKNKNKNDSSNHGKNSSENGPVEL